MMTRKRTSSCSHPPNMAGEKAEVEGKGKTIGPGTTESGCADSVGGQPVRKHGPGRCKASIPREPARPAAAAQALEQALCWVPVPPALPAEANISFSMRRAAAVSE
ncbi:hypothetical protein AGOR_G00220800 [Albula goreensis]|uniref:Uncharacterized protein n=1 Tax=Albula goreensis TaxID=1534307 RepID=A0A8T3CH55_9TELE|nr:hypothetical protein AGOR_G00220800 [Albula goreensis]